MGVAGFFSPLLLVFFLRHGIVITLDIDDHEVAFRTVPIVGGEDRALLNDARAVEIRLDEPVGSKGAERSS